MSTDKLTVKDVKAAIDQWADDFYVPHRREQNEKRNADLKANPPKTQGWYNKPRIFNPEEAKRSAYGAFLQHYAPYDSVELSVGTTEPVVDEREDSEIYVVFKIGDQFFKATTAYDSWNDTEWGYADMSEVVPKEVTIRVWVNK